jgi:hypothetical protein
MNGIVIMTYCNEVRASGFGPIDAMFHVCFRLGLQHFGGGLIYLVVHNAQRTPDAPQRGPDAFIIGRQG